MHLGFSYVGLFYLVLLFVPNILWTRHQPKDYELYVKNENKFLLFMERAGEILVTCAAVIFSDFNPGRWTAWGWWLVISFLLMVIYEIYWVRYFRSEKTMKDFYGPMLGIPVPGASLPVAAFFLLGIYGSNSVMILSSLILGIGHIGIHRAHAKEALGEDAAGDAEVDGAAATGKRRKSHMLLRFVWGVVAWILVICLGMISAVIAIRNVKFLKHYVNFFEGVDEEQYISLGGQEQYVLMTGKDVKNPVIIYLHGGPASPDSFCTYTFADYLTDEYTFICWDQRGCGRTYFRNREADPDNATVTMEQALTDLDQLVDYARERFGQEKVIVMGHSYGTILGSRYVKQHPEKVSAYIGVAQVTDAAKMEEECYQDALNKAHEQGRDYSALEEAYRRYSEDPGLVNRMRLTGEASKFHPAAKQDHVIRDALTSPYFAIDDLKWFLVQTGGYDELYRLDQKLFDATFAYNADEEGLEFEVPVYLISGSDDWVCPVDAVRRYKDRITAPKKSLTTLEGCGHNVQYTEPEEFASTVKELLK